MTRVAPRTMGAGAAGGAAAGGRGVTTGTAGMLGGTTGGTGAGGGAGAPRTAKMHRSSRQWVIEGRQPLWYNLVQAKHVVSWQYKCCHSAVQVLPGTKPFHTIQHLHYNGLLQYFPMSVTALVTHVVDEACSQYKTIEVSFQPTCNLSPKQAGPARFRVIGLLRQCPECCSIQVPLHVNLSTTCKYNLSCSIR
jgi:hypothetical protein